MADLPTPSEHPREQALFLRALDLDPAGRAAFLDRECAGDAALRARLTALLAAHEVTAAAFLPGAPAARLPAAPPAPAEAPGDRLGRYKLLEKVGEGGCGVVYVAEQSEPVRRRVALKVIKLGMDTKAVVARFEAERQALAMMDHPNIAKVLDAGASERGRPYFVMELVRGIPITEYCDQNQLSTEARLGLFIQVCQAVQHAHQKGIIHRDLKPSNILVTVNDGVPVPKVIDFGIAKATEGRLTDATIYTQLHQFIGTPAYMSPEQAEMTSLDIDTRSDIYSLGVLLYELLAGRTPFEAKELMAAGLDAMRRMVREVEPARPSTKLATLQGEELSTTAKRRSTEGPRLLRQLRGDLDWIVMKCLEKDRTRRYETANGLAADLQRHLSNEPVVARPPEVGYRLHKFFRRHRTGVLAAATILLALVVTAAVAVQAAVHQARSRELADRQRRVIEAVNAFFTDEILGASEPEAAQGRVLTIREVLDQAAAKVPGRFAEDPLVEAAVRIAVGRAYRRLGAWDAARPQVERAYAICVERLPAEADLRYDAITALARLEQQQGNWEAADRLYRGLVDTSVAAYGEHDDRTARALRHLGSLDFERERYPEAETNLARALAIQRRLHGERHLQTIIALNDLAITHAELGRTNSAEALQQRSLELAREVLGPTHPETFNNLNNLAVLYRDLGRHAEAEALHRESLALHLRVYGPGHPHTLNSRHNLARLLARTGRTNEALAGLRAVLAERTQVLGREHPDTLVTLRAFGTLLLETGQFAEAEPLGVETVELTARVFGSTHARGRAALEHMVRLHEAWAAAEPARSAAPADAWRARLAALDAAATTATDTP